MLFIPTINYGPRRMLPRVIGSIGSLKRGWPPWQTLLRRLWFRFPLLPAKLSSLLVDAVTIFFAPALISGTPLFAVFFAPAFVICATVLSVFVSPASAVGKTFLPVLLMPAFVGSAAPLPLLWR